MMLNSAFGWGWNDTSPVAELFHENSKLPPRVSSAGSDGDRGPGPASSTNAQGARADKAYRTGARISLPPTVRLGSELSEVLKDRHSVREYAPSGVNIWHLGQVLGWSYGVMARDGGDMISGRPAPSAGALYPIEIYAAAEGVTGLDDGVYHYNAQAHELETVRTDGGAKAVRASSLYPEITSRANVLLVMVAVFPRTCLKYGERGYRFVLLDCGHVAQNLHLVSSAIGLGSVGIGGFLDDDLNEMLELDGVNEAVVHTMALGLKNS